MFSNQRTKERKEGKKHATSGTNNLATPGTSVVDVSVAVSFYMKVVKKGRKALLAGLREGEK